MPSAVVGTPPAVGHAHGRQRGSRSIAGVTEDTVWTQSQAHGDHLTGRRAKGIPTPPRGVYGRALKPREVWEGPVGTGDGCQPDAGNPTVRDERGACGNMNHGGTRTPLHNRKGA